ncbi:hypothetical protein DFH06DRAFT_1170833 [Mycena polygramma]|nr:hypothetical protein DFH06DRAFT_1170833 [Mycena polygramma]
MLDTTMYASLSCMDTYDLRKPRPLPSAARRAYHPAYATIDRVVTRSRERSGEPRGREAPRMLRSRLSIPVSSTAISILQRPEHRVTPSPSRTSHLPLSLPVYTPRFCARRGNSGEGLRDAVSPHSSQPDNLIIIVAPGTHTVAVRHSTSYLALFGGFERDGAFDIALAMCFPSLTPASTCPRSPSSHSASTTSEASWISISVCKRSGLTLSSR